MGVDAFMVGIQVSLPTFRSRVDNRNGNYRIHLLALLSLWIVTSITVTQVLQAVFGLSAFVSSTPTLFVAISMAYVVYLDYTAGQGTTSRSRTDLILALATGLVPPFVLFYLWKRDRKAD